MSIQTIKQSESPVYFRLIALWVICEAFAGGIMHGIKLPFSGLIVSSLAVICIVQIAWHVPIKFAIIKATVIVAIFKLMLSPHSPPTAYIAVFFQGLVAELLFSGKRHFKFSAILLAVLALVESSIQRILVLLIVYGNGFWKAVNIYINKLTGDKSITNYSLFIAIGYIVLHAMIGFLIGIYASATAKKSAGFKDKYPGYFLPVETENVFEANARKKKKKLKWIFIIIWILLLALMLQAYFMPSKALINKDEIIGLLLRSVLILLAWYLFIAPIVLYFIKKLLTRQQEKNKYEMNAVLELLPQFKSIFRRSWQLSKSEKGLKRLRIFFRIILINTLSNEPLEEKSN